MKAAVIYFSLEGNMESIANKIGSGNAADVYRLIPKKAYPTGNFSKYFWGGMNAKFGGKRKLANETIDLEKYDTLIIGSPVWAGTLTPPVHTFLNDYKIKGKNIIMAATHSGGGANKCFSKMRSYLKGNVMFETFQFKDPLLLKDEHMDEKIIRIRQLIGAES